jgi:hypothetical protein
MNSKQIFPSRFRHCLSIPFADKDYDVPFRQYKKGDIDYKMVMDIFVKQNNEWKITAAQLTLINQMLSPHDSAEKR